MTTKYKVQCAWIKKEQAAHKRALNTWYRLDNTAHGEPYCQNGANCYVKGAKVAKQRLKDVCTYAAALGRKQGKLPINLKEWTAWASVNDADGSVTFSKAGNPSVTIPVRFLNWSPVEQAPDFAMAA